MLRALYVSLAVLLSALRADMTARQYQSALNEVRQRCRKDTAGIPYVKRASGCHAFRHLVGSVIHKETGSLKMAQEQLGHSNVSTTGDIYVHTDDELVNRSAEILGNVLGVICDRSVVSPGFEKGSVQ